MAFLLPVSDYGDIEGRKFEPANCKCWRLWFYVWWWWRRIHSL